MNELLALEEKAEGAGGEISPHPPGWGPLAAGRILSEAGSAETQGGEAADRVVGRLVQLYWKGKFEGQPRRALAALSQIGGAAVPRHFLQAAESPNPQVRESAAAEALAPAGDPEATPPLLKALEDPGIAVRKRAAEALGRIGDPAVLDALAERLRTGTDSEKWSAAEALADWSAPEAVPPPGGRAPRRLRQGPKAGRVCPGTPSLPRRGGGAGRIASGRIGPGPGPGGLRPGPDEIAGGRAGSGPGPGGRK
ncbi:MAG: HEAT repeat domain-containing protein [Nitrospinota bacterium]|nr:HEAT repeat domain-containing protein [Nitrospinota bacterium]